MDTSGGRGERGVLARSPTTWSPGSTRTDRRGTGHQVSLLRRSHTHLARRCATHRADSGRGVARASGKALRAVFFHHLLRRTLVRFLPRGMGRSSDPPRQHAAGARDDDGVSHPRDGRARPARRLAVVPLVERRVEVPVFREPGRSPRRVRAHDLRRRRMVRHPRAPELGAAGLRHADLQQFAVSLCLRAEQPTRPAQRQPGRVDARRSTCRRNGPAVACSCTSPAWTRPSTCG